MRGRGGQCFGGAQRRPVEVLGQDRLDRAVADRANRKRPGARRCEAVLAELAAEVLQAQARPIGVLGVWARLQEPLDEGAG